MGVIHKSILNSIYIEGIVILFELNSPILLITNLLTCCITFFDGMTFDILKNKIAESDEQDKKKGVNWQPSVDNEAVQALPETEPIAAIKPGPAETAAISRQESVSKTEQGAGQTGTAKRKKKKKEKEEVFISK